MTTHLIHKHLIRQISQFGKQSFTRLLQQKIQPEPRLDAQALKETISTLKHTAAHNGLISLSAPQVFFKHRIFVILKQSLVKYGKWNGYDELFIGKRPEDCYDTIINPELVGYSNFKVKGDEECASIEGLKFKVWIPLLNKMSFVRFTEQFQRSRTAPVFKKEEQEFTGFYGRVFDHEYRHLEGILPNLPEICNNQVYLTDDAKQNPENFNFLRNYRLEREYLNEQHMMKELEKEAKKVKEEQKSTKESMVSGKISNFDKMPDQIDSKMKEKLMKAYQNAKGTSNLSPNIKQSVDGLRKSFDFDNKQTKSNSKNKSNNKKYKKK